MTKDYAHYTTEAHMLLRQIQDLARKRQREDASLLAVQLARVALDMAKALRQ